MTSSKVTTAGEGGEEIVRFVINKPRLSKWLGTKTFQIAILFSQKFVFALVEEVKILQI